MKTCAKCGGIVIEDDDPLPESIVMDYDIVKGKDTLKKIKEDVIYCDCEREENEDSLTDIFE